MKILRFQIDYRQSPEFITNVSRAYKEAEVVDLGKHGGDLHIEIESKVIRVETKETDDFINSIVDKRNFQQAVGMREITSWSFLLHKEFRYDDDGFVYVVRDGIYAPSKHWNRSHIEGALTSIQARGVITRCAYEGWVAGIKSILNWVSDADSGSITRPMYAVRSLEEKEQAAVNLLTLFDGIGVKQAREFIGWAGTRPLYKYLELALKPFGKDKPKGWTNNTIEKNRKQFELSKGVFLREVYTPEWSEELDA